MCVCVWAMGICMCRCWCIYCCIHRVYNVLIMLLITKHPGIQLLWRSPDYRVEPTHAHSTEDVED